MLSSGCPLGTPPSPHLWQSPSYFKLFPEVGFPLDGKSLSLSLQLHPVPTDMLYCVPYNDLSSGPEHGFCGYETLSLNKAHSKG